MNLRLPVLFLLLLAGVVSSHPLIPPPGTSGSVRPAEAPDADGNRPVSYDAVRRALRLVAPDDAGGQRVMLVLDLARAEIIAACGLRPAFRQLVSPGSLLKLVAAWHLLEAGRLEAAFRWRCQGPYILDCRDYPQEALAAYLHIGGGRYLYQAGCSLKNGHGNIGISQAIGFSCNHFFRVLADRIVHHDMLKFGETLGLFAAEQLVQVDRMAAAGRLVGCATLAKRLDIALGHGTLVSVAGIASVYSAWHAGGAVRPLGLALTSQGWLTPGMDWRLFPKKKNQRQVPQSDATRSILDRGMRIAAEYGTARLLCGPGFPKLLVKTGSGVRPGHDRVTDGWVVAAWPDKRPRLLTVAWALDSGSTSEPLVMTGGFFKTLLVDADKTVHHVTNR